MEQLISNVPLSERLLQAWLRLSTSVTNERIVSEMSYNESLVCGLLYKSSKQGTAMTATQLCQQTKILKSQMNRTLNQLTEKKMITRERSSEDKRKILIYFDMKQAQKYEKQHQDILHHIDSIIDELGDERASAAIELFADIANIADKVF